MATFGEWKFGHYRGVALTEGFLYNYSNAAGTKMSDHYREGGLSSGVAFKRGSTVCTYVHVYEHIPNLSIKVSDVIKSIRNPQEKED